MNRLAEYRSRHKLTQAAVAERMVLLGAESMDANAVSRHEREVVDPQPHHRAIYARLYGTEEETLFPPAGSDGLADTLAALRRAEDIAGAVPVINSALSLHTLAMDLSRQGPVRGRQRRVHVAAQAAQFIAWLYADLGDAAKSSEWYRKSGDMAYELGDASLAATTLSMRAHLALHHDSPTTSLALADGALMVPGAHAVVRYEATQQYARALAATGDPDLDRWLDLAEERIPTDLSDLPAWEYFFDPVRATGQRAAAYIEAGRGAEAVSWFLRAKRQPDQTRDWVWHLSRLALAYAIAGEADAAVDAASQARNLGLTSAHADAAIRRAARVLRTRGALAQAAILDAAGE